MGKWTLVSWRLRSIASTLMVIVSSCGRDVRLSDREIPTVAVRAVTHYGTILDQKATPEQVAYVLLRAIREDILAENTDHRKTPRDIQFDICAADEITARNRTQLSRDEWIYHVVDRWGPTVSHYAKDFETDLGRASERFVRRDRKREESDSIEECDVLMQAHDPGAGMSASAVVVVYLIRDGGFWRVLHLGFDAPRRIIHTPAKAPATG